MVKRYGLFYQDSSTNGALKMIHQRGCGEPLFETENEAGIFIQQGRAGLLMVMVMPVYVTRDVAERQTIEMYR